LTVRLLIIGGAAAVLAYLLFFRKRSASSGGAAATAASTALAHGTHSPTVYNRAPATTVSPDGRSGVSGALATVNQVSATGCAAVAVTRGGAPVGMATTGCQLFTQYATPTGQAELAWKGITKIGGLL
jgi:hypothetical protein